MSRITRRPRQMFLDGLFAVMLLHFVVTGHIVPRPLIDLFHDRPQVVVSVEPELIPDVGSDESPAIQDGDLLPETRSRSYGPGAL